MIVSYKVVAIRRNWYLAAILPNFIDDRQKGFSRGRLGIDHVIDIESAAFALAVQGASAPALLFIDIEAAFPSVPHRFLFKCLRRLAGDHPVVWNIIDLHSGASTALLASGEKFPRFPCDAGVRQGCNLTPLFYLFISQALASWLRLHPHLGITLSGKRHTSTHHADDTQIHLPNLLPCTIHSLYTALSTFSAASGQSINTTKSKTRLLGPSPSPLPGPINDAGGRCVLDTPARQPSKIVGSGGPRRRI
jgi:hypothetical protein